MNREPLVTVGTVTAGTTATIAILVAYGVPMTEDQRLAILGGAAFLAPFVVAIVGRFMVTPNSSVVERRKGGEVVAGEGHDLDIEPGEHIRNIDPVWEPMTNPPEPPGGADGIDDTPRRAIE